MASPGAAEGSQKLPVRVEKKKILCGRFRGGPFSFRARMPRDVGAGRWGTRPEGRHEAIWALSPEAHCERRLCGGGRAEHVDSTHARSISEHPGVRHLRFSWGN